MSCRLAARIGWPSQQRLLAVLGPTTSWQTMNSHSLAGVRNSQSLVKGRRLHWLHGCTGSRDRLAPAASAERAASTRASSRRPIGGPAAAGTAWRSGGPAAEAAGGRPVVQQWSPRSQWPSLHWWSYDLQWSALISEISVITAIAVTAVTVDIVALAGRCRHERAARTARAAAVLVCRRRGMTNHAMVAAQAKEAGWKLLQTASWKSIIIRIIQIIKMTKMMI